MLNRTLLVLAVLPFAWACGSTMPEPKQPMADAESASRSAREVGAASQADAKLHVTLAEEQIAKAKSLIGNGENERATYLLLRARADAELALALAREQNALVDKQRAVDQSNASRNTSIQGAKP